MGTKKRRKKKAAQNDFFILKLLVLVAVVLVIFEGRLVYTMFTHKSSPVSTASGLKDAPETESEGVLASASASHPRSSLTSEDTGAFPLAGLSAAVFVKSSGSDSQNTPKTEDPYRVSEEIDSLAVVKETSPAVDDSYFSDAVFIGDSRMQGFQNTSGITQGDFLTSVGLGTDGMSNQNISTPEGNISVYQGLSGKQYKKIYLMLGTNDLGYYPWESFKPNFTNVIEQFHKLQPDALIYICSVIYVEESKISTSYDNNENVSKINGYLLEVAEEKDYCYYINLNEIFTNGYGSLLEGASPDGIHLEAPYCQQMLSFLKSHYVPDSALSSGSARTANAPEDTEEPVSETETAQS